MPTPAIPLAPPMGLARPLLDLEMWLGHLVAAGQTILIGAAAAVVSLTLGVAWSSKGSRIGERIASWLQVVPAWAWALILMSRLGASITMGITALTLAAAPAVATRSDDVRSRGAWVLHRSLRDAMLVGLLGAGGLGAEVARSMAFRRPGTFTAVIALVLFLVANEIWFRRVTAKWNDREGDPSGDVGKASA